MFCPSRPSPFRHLSIAIVAATFLVFSFASQNSLAQAPPTGPSSSSSSSNPEGAQQRPVPRIAQPEAGGSAITLENSEPLFYVAVGLNVCGYDAGLADSSPVRQKIRDEINDELAASAPARDARDALCTFIREHALNDPGRSLAQYISLALYLGPPPMLTPTVDESDLPPDSTQVIDVLPLLRTFADAARLHALWYEHHAEYEGFIDRIHDPLTHMVESTNIYLHLPLAGYEGRRFLVLLEPMLSPAATNARIYGDDYVVVVSPATKPPDSVPMEMIRHTYLHFVIEPLVYARPGAMDRLLPLLKSVQDAPLEFYYKSNVDLLLTECLIKAVEAQTMDVGLPVPVKPNSVRDRSDFDRYQSEMAVYDRQAEAVRRKAVDLAMRQGWILCQYFYNQLGQMSRESQSLKDAIGPMVYGMDVGREQHSADQIVFLPQGSDEDVAYRAPAARTQQALTGMDLAETKLAKGDLAGAEDLADAALKTDSSNARAHFMLGRIALIAGHPEDAQEELTQTIRLSHDPRTTAWAHIYLGRMYDIAQDPDNPGQIRPQRDKAIPEYEAALASRDSQPDTKDAAEKGIKQPFTPPKRTAATSDQQDDSEELDPTGKAQKESYRPTPPK